MANPNVERLFETLIAYQQGDDATLRRLIHPEGELEAAGELAAERI